ncbi:hypothetical protein OH77DRAFT_1262436 [Trametes cingulata]|nr:hypothetical protein OH77DRAFT_1262436 [Trametes cingulata]
MGYENKKNNDGDKRNDDEKESDSKTPPRVGEKQRSWGYKSRLPRQFRDDSERFPNWGKKWDKGPEDTTDLLKTSHSARGRRRRRAPYVPDAQDETAIGQCDPSDPSSPIASSIFAPSYSPSYGHAAMQVLPPIRETEMRFQPHHPSAPVGLEYPGLGQVVGSSQTTTVAHPSQLERSPWTSLPGPLEPAPSDGFRLPLAEAFPHFNVQPGHVYEANPTTLYGHSELANGNPRSLGDADYVLAHAYQFIEGAVPRSTMPASVPPLSPSATMDSLSSRRMDYPPNPSTPSAQDSESMIQPNAIPRRGSGPNARALGRLPPSEPPSQSRTRRSRTAREVAASPYPAPHPLAYTPMGGNGRPQALQTRRRILRHLDMPLPDDIVPAGGDGPHLQDHPLSTPITSAVPHLLADDDASQNPLPVPIGAPIPVHYGELPSFHLPAGSYYDPPRTLPFSNFQPHAPSPMQIVWNESIYPRVDMTLLAPQDLVRPDDYASPRVLDVHALPMSEYAAHTDIGVGLASLEYPDWVADIREHCYARNWQPGV